MIEFLFKKADIDRSASDAKILALIRFLIFACAFSCFTHFIAARAVVGISAIIFLCLPQARAQLFRYRGSKLLALFILMSGAVALIYQNFHGALITLSFGAMMIVCNTARSHMSGIFFESVLDTMCVGSIFATAYSVFEKFVLHGDQPGYRAMAWFPNPNFFGATLLLIIILCAYKVVQLGRHAWPYVVVAIINAVGLWNCKSMSLWLIAFICVVLLLIFAKRYLLLALLLGFAALALTFFYFNPEIFGRFNEIDSTINNRVKIWTFAIEQWKGAPIFGRGFFSYKHLYNLLRGTQKIYKAALCHNILIDSLLCHGVVGTGLLITVFVRYLQDVFSYRKQLKRLQRYRIISTLILSTFIALFLYGLIDTTLVWIQGGTVLLLITAGIGVEERIWLDSETKE